MPTFLLNPRFILALLPTVLCLAVWWGKYTSMKTDLATSQLMVANLQVTLAEKDQTILGYIKQGLEREEAVKKALLEVQKKAKAKDKIIADLRKAQPQVGATDCEAANQILIDYRESKK